MPTYSVGSRFVGGGRVDIGRRVIDDPRVGQAELPRQIGDCAQPGGYHRVAMMP